MPEPPTPPRSKDTRPLSRLHYTRQTGERLVIKRMRNDAPRPAGHAGSFRKTG